MIVRLIRHKLPKSVAGEHITIKHSEGYSKGLKTVNTIEGSWSILKNGLRRSYRAISKKYLPFYLAGFLYKCNRRHLHKDLFRKFLENSVKDDKCIINYKPKAILRKLPTGAGNKKYHCLKLDRRKIIN